MGKLARYVSVGMCLLLGAAYLSLADVDRSILLEARAAQHDRMLFHEKYTGNRTCTYPKLTSHINIPVFYINMNASVARRRAMETYYGCLDLYRIPGIEFTPESGWLMHPFSDVAGLVDDLEGMHSDPFDRRPQEPYLTPSVYPTYVATIGCLLSHLRAAYIVASLGLPHALIMEDDVTPELQPGWKGVTVAEIIRYHNFTALQLSVLAPEAVWEQYERDIAGASAALTPGHWMASNGAYVLSAQGAASLRNTFIDFVTLKFTIDKLQCVNVDCCVMSYLNDSFTRLPPLFQHWKPSAEAEGGCEHMHELGGSTLTCGSPYLRAKQRAVIEQSRRGAHRLTFGSSTVERGRGDEVKAGHAESPAAVNGGGARAAVKRRAKARAKVKTTREGQQRQADRVVPNMNKPAPMPARMQRKRRKISSDVHIELR